MPRLKQGHDPVAATASRDRELWRGVKAAAAPGALGGAALGLGDVLQRFQRAAVACGADVNPACPEPLQVGGRTLARPSDWDERGANSLAESLAATIAYVLDGGLDLDSELAAAE